jgi:hypothetical protein
MGGWRREAAEVAEAAEAAGYRTKNKDVGKNVNTRPSRHKCACFVQVNIKIQNDCKSKKKLF